MMMDQPNILKKIRKKMIRGLKNLAAPETRGVKKPVSKQAARKDKKQTATDQQWDEWKQKDDLLVDDQFEGDLQNAILLSKLDYEEKKTLYESNNKAEAKKAGNKKKKNKAIPLNQFLGNSPNDKEKIQPNAAKQDEAVKNNFFDTVTLEAQEELNKEKMISIRKERDANIEERITIAQCQEKLENERAKNAALAKEMDVLKEELKTVKSRNKALCDMLGHGEMKDKADVLIELEKLNAVKNELTEEVSRLHGLLEQERSKVASLMDLNKQKEKKNKKHV